MTDTEKKTWYEDYLKLFVPESEQKETCRIVCKEVCKKILEEIHKHSYYADTYGEPEVIKVEEVFKIIKDLGVEL